MKFQVYADQELFETVLLEADRFNNWNSILRNYSDIFLNLSQEKYNEEIAKGEDSVLYLYLQDTGGNEPIPSEQFFKDFEANNDIVESLPLSAFFLEKDDTEILRLQEHFGLLFQNDKIDDNILTSNYYWDLDKEVECSLDEDKKGWSALLHNYSKFSNVLVLNDPYLFDNPELIGGEYVKTGVINIINFLDKVLPKKLRVDYHLLIFTGNDKKEMSQAKALNIFNSINSALKKLRDYNVILEFIISPDTLHRRRAYSNYVIYKCDQGFDLFSENRANYPKTDNDLTIDELFTSIKSIGSSIQVIEIQNKTTKIKKSVIKALDNIKKNNVLRGEKCYGFQFDYLIKNRLINYFP